MAAKSKQKLVHLEQEMDRCLSQKDWTSVSSLLEKYSRDCGGSLRELLVRGQLTLNSEGKKENVEQEALQYFQKAFEIEPKNAEAVSCVGCLQASQGQWETALQTLLKLETSDRRSNSGYALNCVLQGYEWLYKCQCHLSSSPQQQLKTIQQLISIATEEKMLLLEDKDGLRVVERNLLRLPAVHLQQGDVPKTIRAFRSGLLSGLPLSDSARIRLLSGLAEVFLFKTCREQYPPLDRKKVQQQQNRQEKGSPPVDFYPHNLFDEAILCLVISEQLSSVSHTFHHDKKKEKSLDHHRTKGLTVAYAQSSANNFSPVANVLKKELAHNPEDPASSWFLYGMSLSSSGKHSESLFAFKQCTVQQPHDPLPLLMAAKTCVNHLPDCFQEAISFSRSAITLLEQRVKLIQKEEDKKNALVEGGISRGHLSKGYHLLGLGYYLSSVQEKSTKHKREAQLLALEALHHAHDITPNDPVVLLHLGLQYSEIRDLTKASSSVRQSLQLNPHCDQGWVLLSLVLSAQQLFDKAVESCDVGLRHFPRHVTLLHLKAKICQAQGNHESALELIRQGMEILKEQSEEVSPDTPQDLDVRSSEEMFPPSKEISNPPHPGGGGGSSLIQEGGGGKKKRRLTNLEIGTLDEPAIPTKFFVNRERGFDLLTLDKQQSSNPNRLKKLRFWIDAARIFLEVNDQGGAANCAAEAHKTCPCSPDVLALEAKLEESQNLSQPQVLELYHRVLQIDPNHCEVQAEVARIHHSAGELVLAENQLTGIVRRNPTWHTAWFLLGNLFLERNEPDRATECFSAALQLQATCPVLPFSTVILSI
eukprot:CAMPEP_0201478876 /NCGR_PEP_ID=MMETSP0151_2-20130828/3639_1 /ASSEMBLY_ACC=CAM_ASM_000257 /TAXON_ID=200890 /ORGANISM="Paramoeba atlantica, Strain 621/1 / CCAP 1560/9" /LENGTH=817 /DNA_ID=CAMNT_0047860115 /DNA_START=18 /DNA_END=2471 /DNA_ORIENTATION=-